MKDNDQPSVRWRKSSYSNGQAACVEITSLTGNVAVRDSKDPQGPRLVLTAAQWQSFTTSIKAGTFDQA